MHLLVNPNEAWNIWLIHTQNAQDGIMNYIYALAHSVLRKRVILCIVGKKYSGYGKIPLALSTRNVKILMRSQRCQSGVNLSLLV